MEDFDVEFKCLLPYVNFESHSFQQLAETLSEWEEKYQNEPDQFEYDEELLDELCLALSESTKTEPLPLDSSLARYLRTKGTLNDTNRTVYKLYDRVLEEIRYPINARSIGEFINHSELIPEMRIAVRDDHSGEREIFVTSLPNVVALNLIETSAHSVCEQLQSEHITLGGERKFKIMQVEAQDKISWRTTYRINLTPTSLICTWAGHKDFSINCLL